MTATELSSELLSSASSTISLFGAGFLRRIAVDGSVAGSIGAFVGTDELSLQRSADTIMTMMYLLQLVLFVRHFLFRVVMYVVKGCCGS